MIDKYNTKSWRVKRKHTSMEVGSVRTLKGTEQIVLVRLTILCYISYFVYNSMMDFSFSNMLEYNNSMMLR